MSWGSVAGSCWSTFSIFGVNSSLSPSTRKGWWGGGGGVVGCVDDIVAVAERGFFLADTDRREGVEVQERYFFLNFVLPAGEGG